MHGVDSSRNELQNLYTGLGVKAMSDYAVGNGSGSNIETEEELFLYQKRLLCGKVARKGKVSRLGVLSCFAGLACTASLCIDDKARGAFGTTFGQVLASRAHVLWPFPLRLYGLEPRFSCV